MSNINEQKAPVVARGPDGKIGVVLIDTRTGKPIPNSWVPKDDPRVQPYLQPGGKGGYRLDPQKFRKKEEEKAKPRPSSVPPGSFNVTPKGTNERKKLDAKIERGIKANAEAQPAPQPAPEPKRQAQPAQVLGIDRRTPLNKDGTLPTRIGLNVKGDTPMQQWAKNFPKLAKRVLKKKTPQAGYGEIKKIKSQLGEQMDTFDTIKEYLLSEGYAASEGAAHAIMTSMSEEWKQSILEQMLPPIDPKKHKAAQKTQKIYNKATQGAGSEKDFLKRTGPQLPGV